MTAVPAQTASGRAGPALRPAALWWPWVALVLVVVVSVLRPDPSRHDTGALQPSEQVTVVGVAGLLASDLPMLRRLQLVDSATGALAVRSEDRLTTVDAGWATLLAGDRASAADLHGGRSRAGSSSLALQQTGCTVVATGPRTADVARVGTRACTITLVEDDGLLQPGSHATRLDQLEDRLVPMVGDGRSVIVVGVGGTDPEQLSVASEAQVPGVASLVSSSTDRAPYVQLIDVVPTVFARVGATVPAGVTGHAWRAVTPATSAPGIADLAAAADAQRSANVPLQVLTIGVVVLPGLGGLLLRRWRVAAAALAAGGAFPLALTLAQLVPWWHDGTEALVLLVLVVGGLAAWRRPSPAVLAGATLGVLAVDLATGGTLQVFSLLGLSPITAGRFIGVGNLAFGVLAAATLVLAHRQRDRVAVLGVCALGIVVDGSPTLGADLGGTVALTLAAAVLLVRGRPSVRQAVVTAVLVVGLPVAAALVDLARPADSRTHLGRFAAGVLQGGGGGTVGRKVSADVESLLLNPLTVLVPFLVLAAVLVGRRVVPRADHRLVAALGTAAVAGLLANDSGVACAASVLLLGVPLVARAVVPGQAPIGPVGPVG